MLLCYYVCMYVCMYVKDKDMKYVLIKCLQTKFLRDERAYSEWFIVKDGTTYLKILT
jgi:hypothetical protein